MLRVTVNAAGQTTAVEYIDLGADDALFTLPYPLPLLPSEVTAQMKKKGGKKELLKDMKSRLLLALGIDQKTLKTRLQELGVNINLGARQSWEDIENIYWSALTFVPSEDVIADDDLKDQVEAVLTEAEESTAEMNMAHYVAEIAKTIFPPINQDCTAYNSFASRRQMREEKKLAYELSRRLENEKLYVVGDLVQTLRGTHEITEIEEGIARAGGHYYKLSELTHVIKAKYLAVQRHLDSFSLIPV